jgi:hypothetical protein
MSGTSFYERSFRAGAIATLALGVLLAPCAAAVIPLGFDKTEIGGLVPTGSVLTTMSGQWVGHDAGGHDVKLELHVAGGAIAGSATLGGLTPNASAQPSKVAQVALAGRTLVFSVQSKPCDKKTTYAVLTIVSPESARLDLETSSRPITFTLSKIG